MQKKTVLGSKYLVKFKCKKIPPNTKDHTIFGRESQLKIEGFYEKIVLADDKVRLLEEVLEGLDFTKLYRAYSENGRPAKTSPKTMFKLLVYANSEGIYSSRDIAERCRRDVNYLWLLNDEPAPSHNTINRFRNKYLPYAAEDLFYQLIEYLYEIGEIQFEKLLCFFYRIFGMNEYRVCSCGKAHW